MPTQTAERQELQRVIDALPDDSIIAIRDFVKSLRPSEESTDDGYLPHIPNAETAAAIREGRAGKVKSAKTMEEFYTAMRENDEDA